MDENILKVLGRKDYVPSNVPELLRRLGLRPNEQQALQRALHLLEKSGRIVRTKGNRYIQAQPADLVAGVIRINRQGRGFLQPDDRTVQEIVVEESATSTALHGDRVLVRRDVRPAARRPADGPATGAVVRVLERKRSHIVGTLQQGKQFLFVIPDDPRIPHDIYVSPPRDAGRPARAGDKVVVALRHWESRHTNPEGEIIEVLGPPDEEGVDMLSVLRQYNLPLHFPKNALREAELIARGRPPGNAAPAELAGRVDCRAHPVITIDPDDAKDFDDAICLERAGPGRWKVWVHIADVSHYVKPGGALDEEARRRGNSTYLVDRVIPMLPEALSNELCSLKPGTDRLTKCVEFLLSERRPGAPDASFIPPSSARRAGSPTRRRWRSSSARRPATRSNGCCNRPTRWRNTSAAPVSRPARWIWIFPTRKFVLTIRAGCCAWTESRTTSRTS